MKIQIWYDEIIKVNLHRIQRRISGKTQDNEIKVEGLNETRIAIIPSPDLPDPPLP